MKNKLIKNITLTGMFIAIGVVLPQMFHIMGLGTTFSPLHIGVLICGVLIGWQYGLVCGIITPLLCSFITGMPPMPVLIAIIFELATYGTVIGLIYQYLKVTKMRIVNIYLAILIAMILGRVVFGITMTIVTAINQTPYGFSIFINSVIISTLPAIFIQLAFIPSLINTLISVLNREYKETNNILETNEQKI